MKIQKETKNETLSSVTKKNVKIAKIILFGLSFIILTGLFYSGFDKAAKFLNTNEFVKYPMVKIQFHKPFEFVPNKVIKERRAMEKLIEEKSIDWAWEIKNPDPVFDINDITQTKEEILKQFGTDFYQTIHKYESTNGKNNVEGSLQKYCSDKGMRNEVGYDPQHKRCFKDEKEEVATIFSWVKRNCENLPLSQCLCKYNEGVDEKTGLPKTSCYYSQGKLSLAN